MSGDVLFDLGDISHAHFVPRLLQRSHGRSDHCDCHHGRIWDLRSADLGSSDYGFAAVPGAVWEQLGQGPLDTSPVRFVLFRPSSRLCLQRGVGPQEAEPPSGTPYQGNRAHGCVHGLQPGVVVLALFHPVG